MQVSFTLGSGPRFSSWTGESRQQGSPRLKWKSNAIRKGRERERGPRAVPLKLHSAYKLFGKLAEMQILIQWVRASAWDSAFLTSFWVMSCCWHHAAHVWSNKELRLGEQMSSQGEKKDWKWECKTQVWSRTASSLLWVTFSITHLELCSPVWCSQPHVAVGTSSWLGCAVHITITLDFRYKGKNVK